MTEEPSRSLVLPLRTRTGDEVGSIRITTLPSVTDPQLVLRDERLNPELGGAAPFQLLEETEYEYQVDGVDNPEVDPAELFSPGSSRNSGRLRTGRATGTVHVVVRTQDGHEAGRCEFEVRSRKLNYSNEYQGMLRRVAEAAAEAVLMRFAPSEVPLSPTMSGDPQTLYQRFALVKELLEEQVDTALTLVLHRPHVEFTSVREWRDPARGMRMDGAGVRALTRPGPRIPVSVGPLSNLPERVEHVTHVETVDTVANRFVKHALEEWQTLVADVEQALRIEKENSPVSRGLREAKALAERLEAHRQSALFADVGELTSFPAGNQVLQRREGYRDVFRAYLMVQVLADLNWTGADDVFRAGQRDVAALYEYWVFLELVRIIGDVTDGQFNLSRLFSLRDGRLTLGLRRLEEAVLEGTKAHKGCVVRIALHFNQQFKSDREAYGSWTIDLRPDFSIRLSIDRPRAVDTWIHFDAKYRFVRTSADVESADRAADDGANDEDEPDVPVGPSAKARTEDLKKMHVYRDAVRRSAGAYVLYPGSDDQKLHPFRMYHEVLPGLGAFVLRPTELGEAASAGVHELTTFIENVIDHLVSEGTSRARSVYWEDASYTAWRADRETTEQKLEPRDFLSQPSDDTLVLLGYVKSDAHWEWIDREKLYNLRADRDREGAIDLTGPELRASFAILYDKDNEKVAMYRLNGAVFPKTASDLDQSGYPEPKGDNYICLKLAAELELGLVGDVAALARKGQDTKPGAPKVMTWTEFALPLEGIDG